MQLDLDELRQRIGRELEEIETRNAYLSAQLGHLIVVEGLVQGAAEEVTVKNELDVSEFRRVVLADEETP